MPTTFCRPYDVDLRGTAEAAKVLGKRTQRRQMLLLFAGIRDLLSRNVIFHVRSNLTSIRYPFLACCSVK